MDGLCNNLELLDSEGETPHGRFTSEESGYNARQDDHRNKDDSTGNEVDGDESGTRSRLRSRKGCSSQEGSGQEGSS